MCYVQLEESEKDNKLSKESLHDIITSTHGNTSVADLMEGKENEKKDKVCHVFTRRKV